MLVSFDGLAFFRPPQCERACATQPQLSRLHALTLTLTFTLTRTLIRNLTRTLTPTLTQTLTCTLTFTQARGPHSPRSAGCTSIKAPASVVNLT